MVVEAGGGSEVCWKLMAGTDGNRWQVKAVEDTCS